MDHELLDRPATQVARAPASLEDVTARERIARELHKVRIRMGAVIATCVLAVGAAGVSFVGGHAVVALCFLATACGIVAYFFLGPVWTHRPPAQRPELQQLGVARRVSGPGTPL